MTSRARNLLLLPLVLLASCRTIIQIALLPFVAIAWVCNAFVGSDGMTDLEELRAGGVHIDRHIVDFHVEHDLTYACTVESVRTVTSPAGLADSQQASHTFDPRTQTLELVSAEVVEPDGTRHSVEPSAVFTRPSSAAQGAPDFVSSYTQTVLFPQLRVGSQTSVKWKLEESGQSALGFNYTWRPAFTLPVGEAIIRITCAEDVPLRVDARGAIAISDRTEGGERTIEATLRDYVGQTPEKAMVSPRDLCPIFVATTIDSWESIGARFHEAVADKVEITPEIDALAAKIVGDRTGWDAARAIHSWVAGNIQYVAVYMRQMSGWVPRPASEVLRNGYGDCKDQYVLMASLLAARGIEAEPVLVNFDRGFEQFPLSTPLQFDHCMAYLPAFDAYSNPIDPYRELGQLDVTLSDKFVVIASREGRIGRTPAGSADENRYRVDQQVTIGEDGQVRGRSTLDFAGRPSGKFRRILALAATTDQAAHDLLSATPRGGVGQLDTSDPSNLDVPLHCEGEWKSDVPVAMGKVIHFATPTGLDLLNPELFVQFISADERHYPALVAALQVSLRHTVRLPAGYEFTAIPKARVTRNAAGLFESRYVVAADGQLVVERVLRIEKDRYSAEEYAALREILVAAATDLGAIVTAEIRL